MGSKKRLALYYVTISLILIALIAFLIIYRGKLLRIIFPFILALVICYIAERPVSYLEKKRIFKGKVKISRTGAIIIVYALFILGLALILLFLLPALLDNLKELISAMPEIYNRLQSFIRTILGFLERLNLPEEVIKIVNEQVDSLITVSTDKGMEVMGSVFNSIGEVVSVFFDSILSFLIAFYFLRDKELISDSLLAFFPIKWRPNISDGINDVSRIITAFVSGQLLVAVIVGILETIGLMIIGVRYPLLLGLIGGLSNIIPIIGPYIGAVPAVGFALLDSPYKALIVAAMFIIVQQIDNTFLTPKIVEGKLGLHPVATLAVVLIGGILYGFVGILLAVPITAIIFSILGRLLKSASRSKLNEE